MEKIKGNGVSAAEPRRKPILEVTTWVLSLLLVLQYLLGIYANLFVEIPEEGSRWAFAGTSAGIAAHMLLGILVLVGAILVLIFAIRRKSAEWIAFSILGLIGVFGALYAGSSFVNVDSDGISFMMAAGTALSMIAYSTGLYLSAVTRR